MPTIFNRICSELHLGPMTGEPLPLSGGYTHRMYALTTTQGRYAVKLLNTEIMRRPDAPGNYRRAEGFEALLETRGLPILPALTIGGRVLTDAEITPAHCARIGDALARIHACARRELSHAPEIPAPIDWPALTDALLACPETHAEGEALCAALPMLEQATRAAADAAQRLPRMEALCHNDMDPKNVLWQGDDFRIIDLECLDYANPAQELLDLAIAWAGAAPDKARFRALLQAYRAAGGEPLTDAAAVYDSRRNYLDWLAYNARRALSGETQEQQTARAQITATIDKIACDQRNRAQLLRWIREANDHA